MDEKRFQSGGAENAALRRRRRRRNAGAEKGGGGRQRGKPNLGVARSLDVVVNGGDGDDVNQLHVTLDTSAASGKWSAAGTEGGASRRHSCFG